MARRERRRHDPRLRNRLLKAREKSTVLDELIRKHAENWSFERLAAIDAPSALAMHELRFHDTPQKCPARSRDLAKNFPEKIPAIRNGISTRP